MKFTLTTSVAEFIMRARIRSRLHGNPSVDIPVPEALLAHFAHLPQKCIDYVVLLWTMAINKRKSSIHVNTWVGRKAIGSWKWGKLLEAVDSCPFIKRGVSYFPGVFSKTWTFDVKSLLKTVSSGGKVTGNIMPYGPGADRGFWLAVADNSSGVVLVELSGWLRSRLRWVFCAAVGYLEARGLVPRALRRVTGEWCSAAASPGFEWDSSPFSSRWWHAAVVENIRSVNLPCVDREDFEAVFVEDGEKDKEACWHSLRWCLDKAASFYYRPDRRRRRDPDEDTGISRDCHGVGRLYHPLSGLKKEFRRRIRFQNYEPGAMVDMSATYWCIVAGRLENQVDKKKLISVLEKGSGGKFYETLESMLETPFASRRELKAHVQRDCMFGEKCDLWSKNHLWKALRSWVPAAAELLVRWRKVLGRSNLAHKLNHYEAQIFVDDAFRHIHSCGIQVLPFHDGLMVAQRHAEDVRKVVELYALKHLGFVPEVKVEYYGQPASSERQVIPAVANAGNCLSPSFCP